MPGFIHETHNGSTFGKIPDAMKLKLFCVGLLLTIASIGFAQKVSSPSPELDWQVMDVPNNVSITHGYEYARSFDAGIIYISESEAIAPVKFKKEFGLIKINKNGQVAWNAEIPGEILGVSKFNNKALVFYDADWKENQNTRVSAQLIDLASGRKLKEEVVYNINSYIDVRPINKPNGEFNCLMVRQTAHKKKHYFFGAKQIELMSITEKLSVIQLTEDLKVAKETDIKSSASTSPYLGSAINTNGDLFIGSLSEGGIRIEKFNSAYSLIGKLDAPLDYGSKPYVDPVIGLDQTNDQTILVAMQFKQNKNRMHQFWSFQFNEKKVSTSPIEEISKEFGRNIVAVNNEKGKNIEVRYIDDLHPVSMISLKDKNIVLREIRYSKAASANVNSTSTLFCNDAIVISFYDKNWKLLKHIGLEKDYHVFNNQLGHSLGFRIRNNKLLLLAGTITGLMKLGNILFELDIDKMELTKSGLIDKGNLGGGYSVEAASTFWFDNSALLNQVSGKGTSLQKIEW